MEEKKQFGTIIVKGELPLEVQLQAEREAVDRKEKEVKSYEIFHISTDVLVCQVLLSVEFSELYR